MPVDVLQCLIPDGRAAPTSQPSTSSSLLLPTSRPKVNYSAIPTSGARTQAERLEEGEDSTSKPFHISVRCALLCTALLFVIVGYVIHPLVFRDQHDMRRKEWKAEVDAHEAQGRDMLREERSWQARKEELDEERKARERERERQVVVIENEREVWDAERERWAVERKAKEQKEQEEKDERESRRRSIAWDGLRGHGCLRYGTREYTATLVNVPLGFDAVHECMHKTMRINGVDVAPLRCDDEGTCGKVTAHWEIDFDEPGCTPWFGELQDKGCAFAGIHHYIIKLENIQDWENWQKICATMPRVRRNGLVFERPTSCSVCKGGGCGHWAEYMIEDSTCT